MAMDEPEPTAAAPAGERADHHDQAAEPETVSNGARGPAIGTSARKEADPGLVLDLSQVTCDTSSMTNTARPSRVYRRLQKLEIAKACLGKVSQKDIVAIDDELDDRRLPAAQRKKLQAMIDRDGGEATRKQLGVARHTMERAALGGTIQRGTVALLTKALAVLCLVLAGCMEGTGNAPAVPDAGSLAAPTAQDAQVQQTTPDGAPIASQAPDARSTPDVTPDALPPDSYVAPTPPDAGVADVLAAIPDARVPDVLVLGPPDATPYVHIVGIQPGNCGYVTVVPRADRLGWTVMNTSLVDHTAFADAGWRI